MPSPSPSATVSPTASETPPAATGQLTVTLDGVSFADATGTRSVAFDDGPALLQLLEQITGELPTGEPIDGPYGGPAGLVSYAWDGIIAIVHESGPATIAVTASAIGAVAITTDHGLAVGASRSDLLAAGAWTLVEDEDPGTASELGLGGRDVPDTSSPSGTGMLGREFPLFLLKGDIVTEIQVPSNDFSDL